MTEVLVIPELSDVVKWAREQTWSGFALSIAQAFDKRGSLTERQENAIRKMYIQSITKNGAKVAEKPTNPVTEVGFYLYDQTIYKVKRSERGNLYAMRRDETGWVYERGAMNLLQPTNKVTPQVAMEYGVRTGVCLFCNAELDDKDGYGHRVGVGPVCAKRHLGMTQKQLAEALGV